MAASNGSRQQDLARTLTEAIGRAINDTLAATQGRAVQQQGQVHTGTAQVIDDQPSQSPQGQQQRQISSVATANHAATTSRSRTATNNINTVLLPSVFGRFAPCTKRKRSGACQPKPAKIYTKDIVCILPIKDVYDIPIPRGIKRSQLAEMGLTGKISINAGWKAIEVLQEISSVFSSAFNLKDGEILLFDYLSIMPGTKKLSTPKISSPFCWNAPEVVSICSQGSLYILAKVDPFEKELENEIANEEIDDTTAEDCLFQALTDNEAQPSTSSHSSSSTTTLCTEENTPYRSYLSLLDSNPIDISDDEDECNEGVQSAIENSLLAQPSTSGSGTEVLALEHVLGEHVKEVMAGQPCDAEVSKNLINVRRKHVLADGMRKMGCCTFQASFPLSVKFADGHGSSEGAVDLGGPTREFLRLALHDMFVSNAFAGPANRKVIVLNQEAKRNNLYFQCGKRMAISICNGAGGGHCLAPCMFNFIVYGEMKCQPTLDDVHDFGVKSTLLQISDCKDKSAFTQVISSDTALDCLGQAGSIGLPKFENKENLLKELCEYFVIDKVRSALEQFKKGLETLNVLQLMQSHPKLLEGFFCHSQSPLTSETMDRIFTPSYSEDGTKQRDREEMVVMHWRDYLQDCENGRSCSTLEDILVFATGTDEVPPLGFRPSPSIQFWDDNRPRSNTCGLVLFLPLYPDSKNEIPYETFQSFMDHAILNSPTFGST